MTETKMQPISNFLIHPQRPDKNVDVYNGDTSLNMQSESAQASNDGTDPGTTKLKDGRGSRKRAALKELNNNVVNIEVPVNKSVPETLTMSDDEASSSSEMETGEFTSLNEEKGEDIDTAVCHLDDNTTASLEQENGEPMAASFTILRELRSMDAGNFLRKVNMEIKKHGISKVSFSKTVLGCKKPRLGRMLMECTPWHKKTSKQNAKFIKMWKWLKLPEQQRIAAVKDAENPVNTCYFCKKNCPHSCHGYYVTPGNFRKFGLQANLAKHINYICSRCRPDIASAGSSREPVEWQLNNLDAESMQSADYDENEVEQVYADREKGEPAMVEENNEPVCLEMEGGNAACSLDKYEYVLDDLEGDIVDNTNGRDGKRSRKSITKIKLECPVFTCTAVHKAAIRTLSSKFKSLSEGMKQIIKDSLGIPDDTKKVCKRCYNRIYWKVCMLEEKGCLKGKMSPPTGRMKTIGTFHSSKDKTPGLFHSSKGKTLGSFHSSEQKTFGSFHSSERKTFGSSHSSRGKTFGSFHSSKRLSEITKRKRTGSYKCGRCEFSSAYYNSVWRHHIRKHKRSKLDVVCLKSPSSISKSPSGIRFNCESCDYSGTLRHQLHLHNDRCHENSENRDGTTDYDSDSIYSPVYPYYNNNNAVKLPSNTSNQQDKYMYKLKMAKVSCKDIFKSGIEFLLRNIQDQGVSKLCVDSLSQNDFISMATLYQRDVSYCDTKVENFAPVSLKKMSVEEIEAVIKS